MECGEGCWLGLVGVTCLQIGGRDGKAKLSCNVTRALFSCY